MVIAFDFDGTIDDIRLQNLANKMKFEKNEVWVVTARRYTKYNADLIKPVLNKIGLTNYQVIYCDDKPKWELLQSINADIYIDNISSEFDIIKNHTNTIPLLW